VRQRAIWAFLLFAAALPPASTGLGFTSVPPGEARIALSFAWAFSGLGLLAALWAAFPTVRYWEDLPGPTRWLGMLPLLAILLFAAPATVTVALL